MRDDRSEPCCWVVINQTQSPAHQRMLERLTTRFGRCLLVTGSPFPTDCPDLAIAAGPPYARSRMAARTASWLHFTAFAAQRLQKVKGRPFLLAVTNPPLLPHLAWATGRLRGWPYGLLVWDVYPDHIVAMGWAGPRNPLVPAWQSLNRRALDGAAVVITLSQGMAEALGRQRSAATRQRPIEVIPNWADTRAIGPMPKSDNPFAVAHGLTEALVVLYSGNMGATHGLASLVEAVGRLGDAGVRLVLIGDGLGRPHAESVARRGGFRNVTFLPYQDEATFPLALTAGDIAVVSQAPGTEHLSLPSKTYSALAAGSAILALTGADSDLARLIREHDVGRVCPRDDPAAIAAILRQLADQPGELARLRANARRTAEAYFSEDAVYERLCRSLAPCIAGATSAGVRAR